MSASVLQFGSEVAHEDPKSSQILAIASQPPTTLGNLLSLWEVNPPRHLKMFRTTCARLGDYLQLPVDEITLEAVVQSRSGFRPFLESRKYGDNSIRSYVNYLRMIVSSAGSFGWSRANSYPEAWAPILGLAGSRKCKTLVQHLATCHQRPDDVTIDDVNRALCAISQKSLSYRTAIYQRAQFWRIIRGLGYPNDLPTSTVREADYGIPLNAFPESLKKEVQDILNWKRAVFAMDRPKEARHRSPTSTRLRQIISMVYGYAVNIRGEKSIESLETLVQRPVVGGFIEWCLNERQVKGQTLQRNLRLLAAVFNQHPRFKGRDWNWTKPLLDSIPTEPDSITKKRKAEKFLDYATLEAIPEKIRAGRAAAARKPKEAALMVRDELLIKWLTILPWRQRNIRECRISGPEPNLFKAPISDLDTLELPPWAAEEWQKNPKAEFWQFHFDESETKTGCDVHALVPRQLISLLEDYLVNYRSHLSVGSDPGTLFLNKIGKPMALRTVTDLVSQLTLRHGGRRVTPHVFRDIVAYTWLKHHPKDYLTLSKHLWHSGPNEVIRTYGSRFNESSGVCMMESWLDERKAKT